MTHSTTRTSCLNILGTLGYISIIFQWLWTIIIVGHPLLSSDLSYLIPTHDSPPVPIGYIAPSPVAIALVIVLTVLVFIITIYILWKLPRAIGRQGGQATKKVAHVLLPVITHHHTPTQKERLRLSRRLVISIKASLIVLPCAALIWAQPIGELTTPLIWIVGLFCAGCSVIYFGIQQLLTYIWRIPTEKIW